MTLSFLLLFACGDSVEVLPIFDGGMNDVAMNDVPSVDANETDVGRPDSGADGGVVAEDAGGPDARMPRPDAGPMPVSCDILPSGDCEDQETQWFWSGGDCSPRPDCPGAGYVSLGECRRAYTHCGGPELCAGPPSFVDGCSVEGGYSWDGASCVPGCDYFTPEATIYATQQECEHVHQSCDAPGGCGPVVSLGCTEINVSDLHPPFSDVGNDVECAGAGTLAHQVLFVAPDDAEYQVRVQVEVPGSPRGARISVSRGICSTRDGDFPPATTCEDADAPARIPARSWTVDAESHRAHTIRIAPRADPDEYSSLTVCVDRAE